MSLPSPLDVYQVATMVWESVLGLPLRPVSREVPAGPVGAQVVINGAWVGRVRLTCSLALARQVSGALFEIDQDQVDEDHIQDALGELANMIGGNIKALLPQPSMMSLPEPFENPSKMPMLTVPMACGDLALDVSVIELD